MHDALVKAMLKKMGKKETKTLLHTKYFGNTKLVLVFWISVLTLTDGHEESSIKADFQSPILPCEICFDKQNNFRQNHRLMRRHFTRE